MSRDHIDELVPEADRISQSKPEADRIAQSKIARRRAEDGLRGQIAQFEALFNSAPLGVYLVDSDFRICQVNPIARSAFGGLPDLLGQDFAAVMHRLRPGTYADEIVRMFRHTLETGEACTMPERAELRIDSDVVEYYEWRIARIQMADDRYGVVCYFKDISDAIRNRQALAAQLADTKLLQTLSAEIVAEPDNSSLHERLLDVAVTVMGSDFASLQMLDTIRNPSGELRLLATRGFTEEAKRAFAWVTPSTATACGVALQRGGRVIVRDVTACEFMAGTAALAAQLETGIHAVQTTPLVSRQGVPVGMISTHWRRPHEPSERQLGLLDILARQAADLIERKQSDDARRRSAEELRDADRRKDEFLAMLAHELRNPLSPIRTGLELIRLAGDTPASVEQVRTMLERQVGHMVRLVDDLLDVSRITSGKIRLQREPTLLDSAVHAAIEGNRAAIGTKRIDLVVSLPKQPCVIDVDPTRFSQVLSNLLHNAAKFTSSGGAIRISAAVADVDGSRGQLLTVSVADTGIGIARDLLPRIFDLFTQGHPPSSHSGLGIGLALARRLTEMHGGTLDAVSEGSGRGSEFIMRVPIASPTAAPAPAERSLARLAGHRVLVIDDNRDAAQSIALLVDHLGGESRVAFDGETGMVEAVAFRPGVVLLDIGLPGVDGYRTCQTIRGALGDHVLMVALTGYGLERDKQRALEAGFNAHLTKPADPRELVELINEPRRT